MSEKEQTIERIAPPVRLEYGAVPLDPWNAREENGESYTGASLRRIQAKTFQAMSDKVEGGWVRSPEMIDRLYKLMEKSLYSSQTDRIDLNAKSAMELDGIEENELLERAKNGTATPSELFEILMTYPKIGSLELAKLSHPCDVYATDEMDNDVYGVLLQSFNRLSPETPKYKLKSHDFSVPAAIILRKRVLGECDTPHGIIQMVQRRSFLVRGDDEVLVDPYLPRKITNPDRFSDLAGKIENYLPDLHAYPNLGWLQPQATSYYAKYVNPEDQISPR